MNIKETKFDGLKALEITTSEVKLTAVTEFGPRIAFLGRPDGENLLYWQNNGVKRGDWQMRGGHRVWVTRPMADEAEETYSSDNDPCDVHVTDGCATIVSPVNPSSQTCRGIKISQLDERTFRVESFITNAGQLLYSGGVWALTCTNPAGGKQYGIPFGKPNQAWDTIHLVIPRCWAGHTTLVNDPQISLNEEFMIFNPQGIEAKRVLRAPHGIIAMSDYSQGVSFIKQSPFNPRGQYPLGCNLAVYVAPGNFMVEMETCGEEATLLPGDTITNAEVWKLVDEVFDWKKPEQIIELMK
jgi:hypothetical protein